MRTLLTGLLVLAISTTVYSGYIYNVVDCSEPTDTDWGKSDVDLGILGYEIEDFEDVNLVTGLKVSFEAWNFSPGGPNWTTPTNTLSQVYRPDGTETFYTGMNAGYQHGIWDGEGVLVNHPDNVPQEHLGTPSSPLAIPLHTGFLFDNAITHFGISIQHTWNSPHYVRINDSEILELWLPNIAQPYFRTCYLTIEGTDGAEIESIRFLGQAGWPAADTIVFDHLAFFPKDTSIEEAVPLPGAVLLGLLGLGFLGGARFLSRRRVA